MDNDTVIIYGEDNITFEDNNILVTGSVPDEQTIVLNDESKIEARGVTDGNNNYITYQQIKDVIDDTEDINEKIGDLDDLHEEIEDRDNLVEAINYVYENAIDSSDIDERIAQHNNAQNAHNNRITNLESGKVDKTNITSGHIGAIGYGTDGSIVLGENDLTNQSSVHITPTKVELSAGLTDSDAKKVELTKDHFTVDNKEVLVEGDIELDGTTITENDDGKLQAIAITDGDTVIDVDEIENIREIASGKETGWVIDNQSQITGTKDSEENYTNVTAITGLDLSLIRVGDDIYIKNTSQPDYWVSGKTETGGVITLSLNTHQTKVDLTNYYTKDETDDLLEDLVSVSETGTSTDKANYITIDGVEYKIGGEELQPSGKRILGGVYCWVDDDNHIHIDTVEPPADKLATPNLTLNDGILEIEDVPNAESYDIYVDGEFVINVERGNE